ncbi:hypothetical protein KAR91_48885 [Candidatus Pacearchaeota archaeon]|nr:hypothetical protein [Candidatus Pacearchaeota archaeon]
MSRQHERTTLLSQDTAAAIRYYCFGNQGEFFERYRTELGMSRSTFYRVMQGEYATMENVNEVELLAKRLGVTDKKGGSLFLAKARLTTQLVQVSDQVVASASIKALESLREFLKENRGALLA